MLLLLWVEYGRTRNESFLSNAAYTLMPCSYTYGSCHLNGPAWWQRSAVQQGQTIIILRRWGTRNTIYLVASSHIQLLTLCTGLLHESTNSCNTKFTTHGHICGRTVHEWLTCSWVMARSTVLCRSLSNWERRRRARDCTAQHLGVARTHLRRGEGRKRGRGRQREGGIRRRGRGKVKVEICNNIIIVITYINIGLRFFVC